MVILNNLLASLGRFFRKKKPARKKARRQKKRKPRKKLPARARVRQGRRKTQAKKPLKKKRPARKRPASKIRKPEKKIIKKKIVKKKTLPKRKPAEKKIKLKKPAKVKNKSLLSPKKSPAKEEGILVGEVTHYFSKIMVCVVKITRGRLRVGDQIRVKGSTSDFVQKVKSLQIESEDVRSARKGQLVGLKVAELARAGDKVYNLPKL